MYENVITPLSVPKTLRFYCIGRDRKRFTQSGAITWSERKNYFFVDPREQNEKILIPRIRNGDFIMFYASRGSGKSTRINAAIHQMEEEFCCLSVSFQTGISFKDELSFWTSFGMALTTANTFVKIPPIRSPHFKEEEVVYLFNQFSVERNTSLDSKIPLDIYHKTSGHVGLVCACGKQIDETLRENHLSINYNMWLKFASFELEDRICQWATIQRLVDEISLPEKTCHVSEKEKERIPDILKACNLLYNRFFPCNEFVKLPQSDLHLAHYLSAEGALTASNSLTTFKIPSPLMRSFAH